MEMPFEATCVYHSTLFFKTNQPQLYAKSLSEGSFALNDICNMGGGQLQLLSKGDSASASKSRTFAYSLGTFIAFSKPSHFKYHTQ